MKVNLSHGGKHEEQKEGEPARWQTCAEEAEDDRHNEIKYDCDRETYCASGHWSSS
jgi:hypothetical protein